MSLLKKKAKDRPKIPQVLTDLKEFKEITHGVRVVGPLTPVVIDRNTLEEYDYERLVLTSEKYVALRGEMEWHGCLTGDCPHSKQADCDKALATYYRELVKEHFK